MQTTEVVHEADRARYVLMLDGAPIGYANYRLLDHGAGPVAEFFHTVIQPVHREQGHAARLIEAALDDVRGRGLRVKATCWFVDQFLEEHPAYADLRAA